MALTKLTSNLIEGGTGTDWVTAIQTSNFTAEAGKGYFVNTTSQVLYVNLPVGVVGMEITIQDYAGTFATNKVILNANGSEKIQGSALEGRINTNNATAVLIYQDATKGWTSQDVELNVTTISWATPTGQSLTYSTPSPQSSQGAEAATFPTTTFTATLAGSTISGTATITGLPTGITASQAITGSGAGNTLTVTLTGTFPATNYLNTNLTLSGLTVITPLAIDYLVVAGGGGGGGSVSWSGGGGGAGGYKTNYNGTSLTLTPSTNYTVTVGAGGAGGSSVNGTNGGISVFNNITSTGGGGGAGSVNSLGAGSNGGSGGGGLGEVDPAGTGIAGQGFDGGVGGDGQSLYTSGGGGGGAGEIGQTASAQSATKGGGNGGAGIANAITGTSWFYAGGGGGGSNQSNSTIGGQPGNGGGGTGGSQHTRTATVGAVNTGGGGGGDMNPGKQGGSGVVILRYPNTYTVAYGAGLTGSTATDGSDKVTTFTAGTGNIQFN